MNAAVSLLCAGARELALYWQSYKLPSLDRGPLYSRVQHRMNAVPGVIHSLIRAEMHTNVASRLRTVTAYIDDTATSELSQMLCTKA